MNFRNLSHVLLFVPYFTTGFNIISLRLKEMYQMITLGGDAELELVDSLDPFSEGIVFSVPPPDPAQWSLDPEPWTLNPEP